uniref:Uncharacterized protein n=1 Tax=Romanomermis culicivorax TaxID=13658 RepID=A0A915KKA6_ROMCU
MVITIEVGKEEGFTKTQLFPLASPGQKEPTIVLISLVNSDIITFGWPFCTRFFENNRYDIEAIALKMLLNFGFDPSTLFNST